MGGVLQIKISSCYRTALTIIRNSEARACIQVLDFTSYVSFFLCFVSKYFYFMLVGRNEYGEELYNILLATKVASIIKCTNV